VARSVLPNAVNMLAAKLNFAVLLVGERSEHAQHAEDERGDEVRRPADGHEPLVRVHLVQSFKSLEGPLEFSDASVITEEKRSSNHSGAFFFAS